MVVLSEIIRCIYFLMKAIQKYINKETTQFQTVRSPLDQIRKPLTDQGLGVKVIVDLE